MLANASPRPDRVAPVTKPSRTRAAAWVLYDLANTVYAATVTFVFVPHAAAMLGDTGIGITQTVTMVLAAMLVPVAGALADRTARTRGYLTVATLCCIGAMAGWAAFGDAGLLPFFALANVAYNVALVFYNALLPQVAADHRTGLLSGIGVGVGYLGTIVLLVALGQVQTADARFLLAAALFLVFALPCMALVRDERVPLGGTGRAVRDAVRELLQLLRRLPRHRPLLLFLLANFFLVDVLNTAILFFARFTEGVFHDQAMAGTLQLFGSDYPGEAGLEKLKLHCGLLLNVLALLFGLLLGLFADRRPLGTMRWSGVALLGALVGAVWFGGNSLAGYLLTLVTLGAFGLAGIWTAGRKVLLLLAPPEQAGAYFGLYGITIKLSVLGSTTYALVADGFGSKAAILSQSIQLLLGLALLSFVRLPAGARAELRSAQTAR